MGADKKIKQRADLPFDPDMESPDLRDYTVFEEDEETENPQQKESTTHHMKIHWHDVMRCGKRRPALEGTLRQKASLVGRVGVMYLSTGTGAWRVRESMNTVARALGVTVSADIGLTNLNLSVFDGVHHYTQSLALTTASINTDRLMHLSEWLAKFPERAKTTSTEEFHEELDKVMSKPGNYKPLSLGLAAALACAGFCFNLGGGIVEVICAFVGAFVGQFIRSVLSRKKLTLLAVIAISVACGCLAYIGLILCLERFCGVSSVHESGYICSMLFIIPGFPLITGGIDIAKIDMRSGLERLTYAVLMCAAATYTGMVVAYLLHFAPKDFVPLNLSPAVHIPLWILASFCGVYGFSYLYNSPRKMAFTAALIGMMTNTFRLILAEYVGLPATITCFIGAFCSGMLASVAKKRFNYPRISLTVPANVISVPGMFMYRGFYFLTVGNITEGFAALTRVILMVLALPLGLVFARFISDKHFRTVD